MERMVLRNVFCFVIYVGGTCCFESIAGRFAWHGMAFFFFQYNTLSRGSTYLSRISLKI